MGTTLWSNWPASRKKNIILLLGLAWCAVLVSVFVMVREVRFEQQAEVRRVSTKLERVRSLTTEYMRLVSPGKPVVANDEPVSTLAKTQVITRSLELQESLVSIRPIELTGGQEGVRLAYDNLNLRQLVGLFVAMSRRGVTLLTVSISTNARDPELANIQLTATQP